MELSPEREQSIGISMMRWSAGAAAVPDPIPLADEILFGIVFGVGGAMVVHGMHRESSASQISQSRPRTSTTGTKSPRRKKRDPSRKQIRSTSHYTSRRNKYYRRQTYY